MTPWISSRPVFGLPGFSPGHRSGPCAGFSPASRFSPLRGAQHVHCRACCWGTSSCWSGSGYPCRETRDEAIDIRAGVQPDDGEMRVCRLDRRDQLAEQVARAPGPPNDVLGVGEHRVQRSLLVAVPELLVPEASRHGATHDAGQRHPRRYVDPHEGVGAAGQQLACLGVLPLGDQASAELNVSTSCKNSGRGVQAGPWCRASISVTGSSSAAPMRRASVVLPDPVAPATTTRRGRCGR